jgi:hypothetical protein
MPEAFGSLFGAKGTAFDPHAAWRYTLMSGLIPAIPLILIRPFLPESPKWNLKRQMGTLRRPSIRELFAPELARTTILTTIMFACSFGVAFGAIQQVQQMLPAVKPIQAEIKKATAGLPKPKAGPKRGAILQQAQAEYTKSQELGGLVGRFALAALVTVILSRRRLLQVFLVPGLVLMPLIFCGYAKGNEQTYFTINISWIPGFHDFSITFLGLAIFLAGFFTVAQFSFWGNYLPHVYPLHLRGTGESFAANIGGRMIGTSFAYVTYLIVQLLPVPPATDPAAPVVAATNIAYVAAGVATALYALNLILSFFLPEPHGQIDEA